MTPEVYLRCDCGEEVRTTDPGVQRRFLDHRHRAAACAVLMEDGTWTVADEPAMRVTSRLDGQDRRGIYIAINWSAGSDEYVLWYGLPTPMSLRHLPGLIVALTDLWHFHSLEKVK